MASEDSWTSSGVSFKHFPDPHASPSHKFQHEAVTLVRGSEDDLIDGVFIDDLPLNWWRSPENLLNDCGIAGVGQRWQACVDAEVVKS